MTGYGRGQGEGKGKQFTVEMKSVNHRFLEMAVRMPRQFAPLEEKIKEKIKGKLNRGRIDVYINVEDTEENKRYVKVDKDLAIAYHESLNELAKTLQISTEISLFEISQLPDIFSIEEAEAEIEVYWQVLEIAVEAALENLIEMRQVEGKQLAAAIDECRGNLLEIITEIGSKSGEVVELYQQKITERLGNLLEEIPIDEQRISMEIAIMAEKSDITEELIRFQSHLDQLEKSLFEEMPIGRKLDFLIQELNREVNTIGSKSHDLEISQKVVDLKSELEKIREQVQNLE